MSSAMNWRAEGQFSSDGVYAGIHLQDAAFDNRIETLREMTLLFLSELESLRSARPNRVEGHRKLCDEVQRFEIDLIRSALDRTGGNQGACGAASGGQGHHAERKGQTLQNFFHGPRSESRAGRSQPRNGGVKSVGRRAG